MEKYVFSSGKSTHSPSILRTHIVAYRGAECGLVVPLLILLNYANRSSVRFIPYSELLLFYYSFFLVFSWIFYLTPRAHSHTCSHTDRPQTISCAMNENDDGRSYALCTLFLASSSISLMIWSNIIISPLGTRLWRENRNRMCLRDDERPTDQTTSQKHNMTRMRRN